MLPNRIFVGAETPGSLYASYDSSRICEEKLCGTIDLGQLLFLLFYSFCLNLKAISRLHVGMRRGTKHTYAEAERNSLIQSAIAFHEEIYP